MSDDTLQVVVDALAVHRLTKLVVDDYIVSDVRDKWFLKFPPESTKLGYLPTCSWCTSFWVGTGVVAARKFLPRAWRPLAYALAFSSVTGLIEEHV